MHIDFNNYKRIFAFGCSFTQYAWPTWADLIALQYSDKEYFNYGKPGLGNVGIISKISEANQIYQFKETDLVMVMYSTFCREDRWVEQGWLTYGNVFNSGYPSDWIKEYADPYGYMIRDHSLINLNNKFLRQSNFGSLILKSTPFAYAELGDLNNEDLSKKLSALYAKEYNELPIDLYNFMGQNWNKCEQTFLEDHLKEPFIRHDFHPYTGVYAEYLESVGVKLDNSIKSVAIKSDDDVKSSTTRTQLRQKFDYLSKIESKNKKQLF